MKQILALAKKLISIPSTADNSTALAEILRVCEKRLAGFNHKEFNKNGFNSLLFYNTGTFPKKFKLILNSHLDVVPARHYKPLQRNGKLYGRGSYDMKTAAAAIILIFKELAKKVNYPLGLQLVTDEEIGGFDGTKYQIEKGVKTDFVIAGENTDLKINHISKGIIWLKVKTRGLAAHGAYPWLGKNAIWKMQKFITVLEKLYPVPNEEVWRTTVNLSGIESSNKTFNQVPDECFALLDIRYVPEDKDKIIKSIKQKAGQDVEFEIIANEPAHLTDRSNKYLQKMIESSEKVLGKKAELVSKHGSSDIRHYNQAGIEGITFGPKGLGHHSDNEWVDLTSVADYFNILQDYLLKLN